MTTQTGGQGYNQYESHSNFTKRGKMEMWKAFFCTLSKNKQFLTWFKTKGENKVVRGRIPEQRFKRAQH